MQGVDDLSKYEADEILRDGSSVRVRAIRPDDKSRLNEHFLRLSPRSIYFRFFGVKRRLTEDDLRRFTEVDFQRDVGLVATRRAEETEEIIGVGRFFGTTPKRAEVAFAVRDDLQGRGVGTLLLEHLSRIAQGLGVEEFEADVLGENNRMLAVFRHSGFHVKRSIDAGIVHVSFPIESTDEFEHASDERNRHAAAQSLRAFLEPKAVAVVGASRRPGSIGAALLENLLRNAFKGTIYPVNRVADRVAGLRAYPTVAAIEAPVDLALIAVPAEQVEAAIADCARANVRGVIVISAGFGEVSPSGRAVEHRLRDAVRGAGMRMVGPNSMGLLNTDPAISLDATFATSFPRHGNVGILSQSGALGLAILDYVQALDLGISTFVSVGNKADVSGNDLLAYWSEDTATQVVVLYLESFGNPQRFARIAPEVARRKPIVAVKSGRSSSGSRAAMSHSASLANLDVAVDALFEQAGVIRTETLEELFDVTVLLSTQPIPKGARVGVITNAGGPAILLADACEAHGLQLPSLSPETRAALATFLPSTAAVTNPVDMIASAGAEQYQRTIDAVGSDPNIDALVVIYSPVFDGLTEPIAAAVAKGAESVPADRPVLSVFLSPGGAPAALAAGARGRLPAYRFPENAAMALSAAQRYGRWRARPAGSVLSLDRFSTATVRAVIDRVLERVGSYWLEPADIATVLQACGIEFATSEVVEPELALSAAERLGFPLVAKAVAPGLLHKSDVGGVIRGLDDIDAVEAAVDTLRNRVAHAGYALSGVQLQREVSAGVETLVGVTSDPIFGPLVVCGMGGVLVELLHDVAFRLPPVSDIDAAEMINKLRAGRLLDGYRGSPAVDRNGLVDVVQRVSALIEIAPEIREIDLNPVKILPVGRKPIVVDARIRVATEPR